MKRLIATTGTSEITAAALAVFDAGGNAVDALVGAALAWPSALAAAGAMVLSGPGFGRGCAFFPARNPGFGLSRPRRSHLLQVRAPSSLVAVPCVGKALAATLSRWGALGLPAVIRSGAAAAEKAGGAPHKAALELLAREGPLEFVRGAWGEEAARTLGPLSGGLLTRRDLIEARPDLGDAFGPVSGLWLAPELDHDQPAVGATPAEQDVLYAVTTDARGVIAAIALESGPPVDTPPGAVMGVVANTLLVGHSPAQVKKVGQPVILRHGVGVGGDEVPTALAGPLSALRAMAARNLEEEPPEGVLMLKALSDRRVSVVGARSVEKL